jgi:hypothetical protein
MSGPNINDDRILSPFTTPLEQSTVALKNKFMNTGDKFGQMPFGAYQSSKSKSRGRISGNINNITDRPFQTSRQAHALVEKY